MFASSACRSGEVQLSRIMSTEILQTDKIGLLAEVDIVQFDENVPLDMTDVARTMECETEDHKAGAKEVQDYFGSSVNDPVDLIMTSKGVLDRCPKTFSADGDEHGEYPVVKEASFLSCATMNINSNGQPYSGDVTSHMTDADLLKQTSALQRVKHISIGDLPLKPLGLSLSGSGMRLYVGVAPEDNKMTDISKVSDKKQDKTPKTKKTPTAAKKDARRKATKSTNASTSTNSFVISGRSQNCRNMKDESSATMSTVVETIDSLRGIRDEETTRLPEDLRRQYAISRPYKTAEVASNDNNMSSVSRKEDKARKQNMRDTFQEPVSRLERSTQIERSSAISMRPDRRWRDNYRETEGRRQSANNHESNGVRHENDTHTDKARVDLERLDYSHTSRVQGKQMHEQARSLHRNDVRESHRGGMCSEWDRDQRNNVYCQNNHRVTYHSEERVGQKKYRSRSNMKLCPEFEDNPRKTKCSDELDPYNSPSFVEKIEEGTTYKRAKRQDKLDDHFRGRNRDQCSGHSNAHPDDRCRHQRKRRQDYVEHDSKLARDGSHPVKESSSSDDEDSDEDVIYVSARNAAMEKNNSRSSEIDYDLHNVKREKLSPQRTNASESSSASVCPKKEGQSSENTLDMNALLEIMESTQNLKSDMKLAYKKVKHLNRRFSMVANEGNDSGVKGDQFTTTDPPSPSGLKDKVCAIM